MQKTLVTALLLASAIPTFAGGHGRHRSPDNRPNHESKHKLAGGSGSSHRGAHLAPGQHYDHNR